MTAVFWWSVLVAVLSGVTGHSYTCLAAMLFAYVSLMSLVGTVMHQLGGCEQDY